MQHYEMVEETATFAAGVFTLGGAIAGRMPWGDTSIDDGAKVYYRAQSGDTEWEIGIGVYDRTAGTISRESTSTRPSGFGGAFSGAVTIAQVVPATSYGITVGFDPARATAFQSAAFAGGVAQAENALALAGAAATHEGSIVAGIGQSSFAPYVDQVYQGFRWSGSADTFSGNTTRPIVDYGGGVLQIEEYRVAVCHALVIASRDSDGALYAAEIRAAIANPGGTPAIVGTPTVTEIAKSAGVTVSATVAAANGGLTITANGVTDYWRWSAIVTGAGI